VQRRGLDLLQGAGGLVPQASMSMAWCRVRLVGAAGRWWNEGMASRAISAASRKPPSVTTPATPRTSSRVTRIEPAEAARASLRLSITRTAPGGHSSTALRCGWPRSWNTVMGFRSSRAGM
jgi:hypothetical protein